MGVFYTLWGEEQGFCAGLVTTRTFHQAARNSETTKTPKTRPGCPEVLLFPFGRV